MPLLCALLLAFAWPSPASGLTLTKTPVHYLAEMEFYYQRPRPETIGKLLESFSREGALASSENRLMLAAFLAELLKRRQIGASWLAQECLRLGGGARQLGAWSVHLAQIPAEKALLAQLLASHDAALAWQIAAAPAPINQWDISSEKTVALMYLNAFMASGDKALIDALVKAALNAPQAGRPNHAAALLYEFAPRHPLIRERLEAALSGAPESQQKIIRLILRQEPTASGAP